MCGRHIGKIYTPANNTGDYGLTTIFEIERDKINKANIEKLMLEIIPTRYNWPEHEWQISDQTMLNKVQVFLESRYPITASYHYGPCVPQGVDIEIQIHPKGLFRGLQIPYQTNNTFIAFSTSAREIEYMEKNTERYQALKTTEKIQFYLDFMKKIFAFFGNPYGWTDRYDYIKKCNNIDSRQIIYAINYYGADRVKQIDFGELEKTGFCKIEKMDWGGVIVQFPNIENPFIKVPELQRKRIQAIVNRTNQI
jgi:hypothetical protein